MTSFNTPIITRSQTSKMATIEEMAQLLSERDNKQLSIINPATFSLYFKEHFFLELTPKDNWGFCIIELYQ